MVHFKGTLLGYTFTVHLYGTLLRYTFRVHFSFERPQLPRYGGLVFSVGAIFMLVFKTFPFR